MIIVDEGAGRGLGAGEFDCTAFHFDLALTSFGFGALSSDIFSPYKHSISESWGGGASIEKVWLALRLRQCRKEASLRWP